MPPRPPFRRAPSHRDPSRHAPSGAPSRPRFLASALLAAGLVAGLAACGGASTVPDPDPAPDPGPAPAMLVEGRAPDWSGGAATLAVHVTTDEAFATIANGSVDAAGAIRLDLVAEPPADVLLPPADCAGARASDPAARTLRFTWVDASVDGNVQARLAQASSREVLEHGTSVKGGRWLERLWSDRPYRQQGSCASSGGLGAAEFRYDLDVAAGWNLVETSYESAGSSGAPTLLFRTVASSDPASDLAWRVRP